MARPIVLYDGTCSFCVASKRMTDRIDVSRALEWLPIQRPEAARFGISRDLLEERMYMVSGDRRWSGFAAWKQILLRLPVFYVVVGASVWITPWALAGWLLLYLPPAAPVGEWVYDWVARNRFRFPGATCQREPEA